GCVSSSSGRGRRNRWPRRAWAPWGCCYWRRAGRRRAARLDDPFTSDTRKEYEITGEVSWQQGRLIFAAGASLRRRPRSNEEPTVPPTVSDLHALLSLLDSFLQGEDRSVKLAGMIEVAIDKYFPEDEQMQNAMIAFASYNPGGGDYLFSDLQILPICQSARDRIMRELDQMGNP